MVASLFPAFGHAVHVHVHDGVVTLRDTSLVTVAVRLVRLVRAVEGVVDVELRLTEESSDPVGPGGRR